MKNLAYIALMLLTACSNPSASDKITTVESQKEAVLKLKAKIYSTVGDVTTDSSAFIESSYFEISLSSVNNGEKYLATHQLVKPQMNAKFHSVNLYLVDGNDSTKFFKESTEFLNYMDAHGYAMVDQKQNRFGADYTFKKKD